MAKAISKTAAIALAVILIIAIVAGVYLAMQPKPTETSPTTTASPSPTTTTPAVKNQIVIGVTDKVSDLDPANAYDFFTWEVLQNTMEGLMKYKPGTTELTYGIAESYEVKEDGKVYIFHLKKNLKFADGTPCTAHDVVRSIKRVMKINGDPAWLVTEFVEDVEALDDYTVKFTLKKPVSYFLALVATPPYFPVHPAYKPDEIDSDQTAGGLGPYKIVKWVRDQELVLEANPYYHGEKPKIKTVIIRFYKDATTLRLALERGEIDIAWRTLNPADIESLKKNPNFQVIEVPGAAIRYIIINVKMPGTDNKLVRQALAAAIDRVDISQRVYLGTWTPLYSLIPKGMWSYKPVFKEKYGEGANLELAKKLLKEAGYSEDKPLEIELWYTPTHYGDTEKDLAAVLKEQFEATGMIKVTIKSAEWSQYLDFARKGAMQLSLFGWYPDYIDPDDYTTPFLHSKANKWTGSGYANPKVDELLDEAAIKLTPEERTPYYEQVQEILADEVPIIPLVQGKLFVAAKKNVGGIILDPTMQFRYWLLYWKE
ncbi:MAG: peptide ABC transporter substrate-binding protein [Desulfurococcales archaeon ex4484_217_2]|nr:MAG: peptide ABC transporter substrate-binding protein [Desulfurococcales archaeon ex4484_217_2]